MRFRWIGPCLGLLGVGPLATVVAGETPLLRAEAAHARGAPGEALLLVEEALASPAEDRVALLFLRGILHAETGAGEKAVADFSAVIQEQPGMVRAWYLRGREHYRLGLVDKAVADFERVLALEPSRRRRLWELGIAYYHVGRFRDGQAMFEAYQTFDGADVENVVWRYLCMARENGPAKAREEILPVGDDPRSPCGRSMRYTPGQAVRKTC